MGSFERFKTKTHFNSLKRLVGITALGALAVKLLAIALATAAGGGTPLDLLARVPACLADLGAALLVFEVLRSRRPLQLAVRSAVLVAVSPVLFVASGIHGDPLGVAVALLLAAMWLLVDRDAPLVAGITLALASRVEPMVLLAVPVAVAVITSRAGEGAPAGMGGRAEDGAPVTAGPGGPRARRSRLVHFGGALAGALLAVWVPSLAWRWDSLAGEPGGVAAPGGLGPAWVLARSLDQGLAGWLLGPGRALVLVVAVVPAAVWVWARPRRVYAAVGLVLLAPLALAPAWTPRDLVWPAVFGYLGDARWASIYAVVAGATLLWTSTWWGTGLPWAGGVDPATVPSGSVAGLGLVTGVVLGSWLVLGWRTVAVEAGAAKAGAGAVDNRIPRSRSSATLPEGAPQPGGEGESRLWDRGALPPGDRGESHPGDRLQGEAYAQTAGGPNGSPNRSPNGSADGAPDGVVPAPDRGGAEGTRYSRRSVGVPK